MKILKFKEYKLIIFTLFNVILFISLYYQHRIYLSQGAIVCYGENCKQTNTDGSFSNLRNERSTPTEFILPSSTAVANIQEQKKNSKLNLAEMNCLIILDDIGFKVLDLKSPNNANSIAAIFEYQETQKLKTTGKLNLETRLKLGC